jgi:uncharacterized membrane protein YbhN (UPF0104 family)
LSIRPQTTRRQTYRRWFILGFSFVLTAVTLYFVFRRVDKQVLERLIATQDRGLLAAAAFSVLLQIVFAGERWRAILSALTRGPSPSALSVQAVFYSSIFFNCLPFGTVGGDVARVLLARKFDLSVGHLVLSVLVDRILTVAALIILAVVTLPTIGHPLAVTASLCGVALLAAGVGGVVLLGPIERVLGRWRHRRIVYLALRSTEELRYGMRHGGLPGLFFAVLSAACSALAAYCIARSLDIGVGPLAMIAIFSMVTLVVALPISLAGWGLREVSVVALLGLLGVDRAAALLLSVEFGLLGVLLSLPGGVIWLMLRERRDLTQPAK